MPAPLDKLYQRQMKRLGRGVALWDPSPDHTTDGQDEPVQEPVVEIGHLGYIQDGKWRHVLDVHRPAHQQHRTALALGETFVQLPRISGSISNHLPVGPCHFTPSGSTSFTIQVAANSAVGSVTGPTLDFSLNTEASLIYFGRSQRVQVRDEYLETYKQYAIRNLRNWEEMIRRNGWSLSVHKLSIVTDRTLAPSWINSVRSERTAAADVGAQVSVNGATSGGLSVSFRYSATTGLVTQYGPYPRLHALVPGSPQDTFDMTLEPLTRDNTALVGPLDQCLFIKRVHAVDRLSFLKSLTRLSALRVDAVEKPTDNVNTPHAGHANTLSPGASTVPLGDTPPPQDALIDDSFTQSIAGSSIYDEDEDHDIHQLSDSSTCALAYILESAEITAAVYHDDDIFPYLSKIADNENYLDAFHRIRPRIFTCKYEDYVVGSLSELYFGREKENLSALSLKVQPNQEELNSAGFSQTRKSMPLAQAATYNESDINADSKAMYTRESFNIVRQAHPLPLNQLPDPELVFDVLLKRDKFVPHPAGLNSMLFAFAALVAKSIFRTSRTQLFNDEPRFQIDLSPLYGHNKNECDKLRAFDGRGTLKKDTFADDRSLSLPPTASVLLILFNRNHNYIAQRLLDINERGAWMHPIQYDLSNPNDQRLLAMQDDEIFDTARLINCGWFSSIIRSDYFSTLFGPLHQCDPRNLNLPKHKHDRNPSLFDRTYENARSAELNCFYRWHATISELDEHWTAHMLRHVFDSETDAISAESFRNGLREYQARKDKSQPSLLFSQMKLESDLSYKDGDLAHFIKNAVQSPAAAFKPRGTPAVMRLAETMSIRADRTRGVCSLNDFRRSFELKPYGSFYEWNSQEDIAEAAEKLYGNIERLELYVGLQAESTTSIGYGAGLCSGNTMYHAILGDAIAFIHGDPTLMGDYTPHSMTAWGFADYQHDPRLPGGLLGRLFMRTLPEKFTTNSCYAWFPFQTPQSMEVLLNRWGVASQYDFHWCTGNMRAVVLNEYRDVERAIRNKEFAKSYRQKAMRVIDGPGFFIASEDENRAEIDCRDILRALVPTPESKSILMQSLYDKTRKHIQETSFSLSSNSRRNINIIPDVLQYVPLHWVMTVIAGIPLRTKDTLGAFTAEEMYDKIADIYTYLFLDVDKAKEMYLEQRAKINISDLKRLIEESIWGAPFKDLSISGILSALYSTISKQKKRQNCLAQELLYRSPSDAQVVNNILAFIVGTTMDLTQSLVNVVNIWFQQEPSLMKAALASSSKMKAFVCEALRVDPPFRGVYREALTDVHIGDGLIKKGQRLFLDFAAANLDAKVFPHPTVLDLSRPSERYLGGDGVNSTLGFDLCSELIGSIVRAIVELDHVTPAGNNMGKLQRYRTMGVSSLSYEYLGKDQLPTPWPSGPYVLQYNSIEQDETQARNVDQSHLKSRDQGR